MSARALIGDAVRLGQIVGALARRRCLWLLRGIGPGWPTAHRPKTWQPQALAAVLQDLGPAFIKLGQALSVRPDLVGPELATALTRLQDRLPPFPFASARTIIETELGQPLSALFRSFSETPVAAASIAQVHRAETSDGRSVAVKVLRPGIERRFARDLALCARLAVWLERRTPEMRRLRPRAVAAMVARWTALEMDLRMEAAAAAELRENFRDDPSVHAPAVDWERSGRRVLVTEWVSGTRIDDVAALQAAGRDPAAILEQSTRALFLQIFRDGFFHADIHPGNVFIDDEGRLTPVDFGIMGRVDYRTRLFLADMVVGFLSGDYRKVADAHFDAGLVAPSQDRALFAQAMRAVGEPLTGRPLNEISVGRLLTQLFAITAQFGMETQPDLLLLQKTLLTAEGVGRMLTPDVNMWTLIQPLIVDWLTANRGPEARLAQAATRAAARLAALPDALERALTALERLAAATEEARR